MEILHNINSPEDIKNLSYDELSVLADEIREFIVETVSKMGGHLGSNLGVVELTLALHRVFDSPRDAILFDTGHQAYVHKILTGRLKNFDTLRQKHGLSGYPNRSESQHDWIENSHASTALSYAFGLSLAFEHAKSGVNSSQEPRRVVAVVGDGALTGGMAYEALNNLGHRGVPAIIVLNDNGRSYAPTISRLSVSLSHLRVNSSYVQVREKLRRALKEIPVMGPMAYSGVHVLTSALRELVEPHVFFEALGVRYIGPLDGHNIVQIEQALENAKAWHGPIVVHVITHKGKGYAPAEEDDIQRLHDVKASIKANGSIKSVSPTTYTDAFSKALVELGERRSDVVAITAAMPGPTGLLQFQEKFPDRFFDVGIAEQQAVTAAAGMAMGGMRPVVAIYSTFLTRAFDQANLDVGLHSLPVIFALDRAGITGDDGPSHHGVLDMVLMLSVPDVAVFAPSSVADISRMLESALQWDGPAAIRYPKTVARVTDDEFVGSGLNSLKLRSGDGSVAILAVGKMVQAALDATAILESSGVSVTLYDVRVVRPSDQAMLKDALNHQMVITVEDGYYIGGAGSHLRDDLFDLAGDEVLVPNFITLGIPNVFLPQAKPDDILKDLGLDGPGIANSVKALLAKK